MLMVAQRTEFVVVDHQNSGGTATVQLLLYLGNEIYSTTYNLGLECVCVGDGGEVSGGCRAGPTSKHGTTWLSSRFRQSAETRRRRFDFVWGWCSPGARLLWPPVGCPSGGGRGGVLKLVGRSSTL